MKYKFPGHLHTVLKPSPGCYSSITNTTISYWSIYVGIIIAVASYSYTYTFCNFDEFVMKLLN